MVWYRELTAMLFLFALCSSYYVIPALLLLTPIGAALGYRWCVYLLVLMVGLAFAPTFSSRGFRRGWVMGCVLEYFGHRWVDVAVPSTPGAPIADPYDSQRRKLAVWLPHGIVPLGGVCGAAYIERQWPHLYGRMAVAPSVLRLPFLRQLLGLFEIGSADFDSMRRTMRHCNMSVMSGGIAELFLCDLHVERVYLRQRMGFCKLALATGADISLLYVFGATQLFDFIKPPPDSHLSRLSRRLSVSLLLFYGRFFLPIPYRRRITIACGQSLRCTQTERPSREEVSELHSRVLAAVETLYAAGRKEAGPEWVNKPLVIH